MREIRERSVAPACRRSRSAAWTACTSRSSRAPSARDAPSRSARSAATRASASCAACPEGRLDTFELEPKNAEVARESFAKAGVVDRVRIHVGPALEKLREIEGDGPVDLVFIDADKAGYPAYLTWAEEHLRVGGIVLLDNAFAWGGVIDPAKSTSADSARALAECAERLGKRGGRWRATMLPTEEGLAFGVKVR